MIYPYVENVIVLFQITETHDNQIRYKEDAKDFEKPPKLSNWMRWYDNCNKFNEKNVYPMPKKMSNTPKEFTTQN